MEHITTFGASDYQIDSLQLFDGVDTRIVAPLLADCAVLRVLAGQPVLRAESAKAQLYILLRGTLGGTASDGAGTLNETPIATILAGECVGELAVLDDEANPATVIALQDSEVLAVDAARLWQLIDESNGVARNLLRMLSFRIRAANAQLRSRQKLGEFYRELSMVDGLTGLKNRAWLTGHLAQLVDNAHAIGNPLSILMIDIDHFKQFNDTYGHPAGDDALRIAARVLLDELRPRDFAVRYGGEELMVILPNTHQKAALIVAQRLCDRMRGAVVLAGTDRPLPHITASFGIASLEHGQHADCLVAAADKALYRAKQAGRNQVAMA